ncbi:DUF3541 domain-containing protein [Ferrimonas balearica]|nr:DUF3541 domain-containing protein [Ferrimonas balearica]
MLAWPLTAQEHRAVADTLRHTYETQLYTLPAVKAGHYGLRMYRQTGDPRYAAAIWSDMARIASTLNRIADTLGDPAAVAAEGRRALANYQDSNAERGRWRQAATADKPEYLVLGIQLLGALARAEEYGLKHRQDARLRALLRHQDFARYSEDPELIRVWAAQLANQVYWLEQLGEGNKVAGFVEAFRALYPPEGDAQLSDLEYGNKIYGMTHLIFAASRYYQDPVQEADFQWIYDAFRADIDTILKRTKPDIIAEVGLSFLLAGLESDPVVAKTRAAIAAAVDPEAGLIPAVNGSRDLKGGEHRNVLAIMLLDWHAPRAGPHYAREPQLLTPLPWGLVPK